MMRALNGSKLKERLTLLDLLPFVEEELSSIGYLHGAKDDLGVLVRDLEFGHSADYDLLRSLAS